MFLLISLLKIIQLVLCSFYRRFLFFFVCFTAVLQDNSRLCKQTKPKNRTIVNCISNRVPPFQTNVSHR